MRPPPLLLAALLVGPMLVPPSPSRAGAQAVSEEAGEEDPPRRPDPATGLVWARTLGSRDVAITVTPKPTELERAQEEVGRIAERLDALRTVEPHVIWRRIEWSDRRLLVEALADSATHGNVAMMAVRGLYPGRGTAGSNLRPHRTPGAAEGTLVARMRWRVQIRVAGAP